jgi:hypothetical protein
LNDELGALVTREEGGIQGTSMHAFIVRVKNSIGFSVYNVWELVLKRIVNAFGPRQLHLNPLRREMQMVA